MTGTFSFTPTTLQAGQSFNIAFTSSDSHGCSGSAQVSVVVEAAGPIENPCGNHAPIISVPTLPMIGLGQTLQFVVRATDQDGDDVVLSAYSIPAGAAFDRASGNFTFTPSNGGVDMHRTKLGQSSEAIFLARDSKGAETMARVDIRSVINTGNLPLQISVPPGPVLVKSADELSFGVAVSTHLTGCPTKVTALGLPSNAAFDDVTNMFTFKPTPDQVGGAFVVLFSTADCNGVSHQSAVRISVIDSDSACNSRGIGTAEVPVRKLDFNTAVVGDRCGAATVSVTNRGGGSLVISSAVISNPENFRVEGFAQLPATLQPGAVIEFRVFFEPKRAGKASETLTLFTSDPNNPALEIRFLGKGVK